MMEFMDGVKKKETLGISQILEGDYTGKTVEMEGAVHTIRDMGEVAFVILRKAEGLVQCVFEEGVTEFDLKDLKEESAVVITGVVAREDRAPHGFEIRLKKIKILSQPAEILPIAISKYKMNTSLETKLALRPVSLRNVRERAKFKIQEGIVRGFREFLQTQGFTEIHTPKIVARGAEGGSNVFKLDYFNKKAELGQSPQFYKQMLVGVYERVFEIGPVFRAEHHDTSRQLNEYISMDFEMGFIDSFYDIMNMETGALKYILELLKKEYSKELELLQVKMPEITEIPVIRFKDAKDIIVNKYKKKITDFNDFEPEEEQLMCDYAKKQFNSDFIFVTHYPSKKRPFYAMDDPEDPEYTLSFDLLFRGMEITTGGQRIHDYDMQVAKMKSRGMKVEDFESYLMYHKYGAPPHGGLGLGLERLTMNLLGFKNVRYATMFPRDINRVTP